MIAWLSRGSGDRRHSWVGGANSPGPEATGEGNCLRFPADAIFFSFVTKGMHFGG